MAYGKFIAEILPLLRTPPTSRALLAAFRSQDVKAERIAQLIESNPYCLDALRRRWFSVTGAVPDPAAGAELPHAQHLLVQLGMEGARDYLLARQALDRIPGTLPAEPAQVMRHALRAESVAAQLPGENSAIAYAGGMLFDWLALLPASTEVRAHREKAFERGLKAAQIAAALGRRLPALRLRKFLFGAALLESAGPALLALVEPDFPRLAQRYWEKALPRVVEDFAIRARYGVVPTQLAALAADATGLFEPVERALRFCDEPFLLRGEAAPEYLCAAALRLASNMARAPQAVSRDSDPRLAVWKGLELREFPIPVGEIAEISRKLFGAA